MAQNGPPIGQQCSDTTANGSLSRIGDMLAKVLVVAALLGASLPEAPGAFIGVGLGLARRQDACFGRASPSLSASSSPRVARRGSNVVCSGRAMPGGDLEGGADEGRNQAVASLKRAFYQGGVGGRNSEDVKDGDGKASGNFDYTKPKHSEVRSMFGVIRDISLCRWDGVVMLPGYNNQLNVFQPVYTHMFETILAGPQPHYYVHLYTPGGTKNLMNPEYGLRVGSKAPLVGTLMRITSAQRTRDSRIMMVVQGLARVRVIEQTQQRPFARADVQILPDAELSSACYQEASEILIKACGGAGGGKLGECDKWIHSVAHAGAVAAEMEWMEFESATAELAGGSVSQLVPLNATEGLQEVIAGRVKAVASKAMKEAAQRALGGETDAVFSPLDLQLAGVLGGQSGCTLPSFGSSAGGFPGGVRGIEARLWWEMDRLIRNLRSLEENVPVPSQMLGLLPRSSSDDAGGWPEGFMLDQVANAMEGALVGTSSKSPFVRVKNCYDPRRRAQRLSYVACSLLGIGGIPQAGQAILEAWSTEHRLSMLLKLLTDINRELDSRGPK